MEERAQAVGEAMQTAAMVRRLERGQVDTALASARDQLELLEGVHRLAREAYLKLLDHDLGEVRKRLQRLMEIE